MQKSYCLIAAIVVGILVALDIASRVCFADRETEPRKPDEKSEGNDAAIHVELSTDDLDALYRRLKARGVRFHEPPHDEPWERAMQTYDPDGYTVEIAQGRRATTSRSPDAVARE